MDLGNQYSPKPKGIIQIYLWGADDADDPNDALF
jgi:hypothetical protein